MAQPIKSASGEKEALKQIDEKQYGKPFEQEVMHKGGGRMIAGSLTDELHRNFEPSKKFGRVYPMIYDVGVCPRCYCGLYWRDFTEIKDKKGFERFSLILT